LTTSELNLHDAKASGINPQITQIKRIGLKIFYPLAGIPRSTWRSQPILAWRLAGVLAVSLISFAHKKQINYVGSAK
jgi:hypothetical protein